MEYTTLYGSLIIQKQVSRTWPQYVAALTATLGPMSVGYIDGWSSHALAALQKSGLFEEGSALTADEASWVGSLVALGALIGALPSGYIAGACGRQKLLLLMAFPFLIGWGLVILAQNQIPLLYFARVLFGLTMGVVTTVTPLYNEEIAEVHVRGTLGAFQNLLFDLGILVSYIVGASVSYFWQTVAPCLIPITFLLTFVWMPESPLYLVSRHRFAEAEEALAWLRGGSKENVKTEVERLEKLVQSINNNHGNGEEEDKVATFKAVTIVVLLMVFRQLTGVNAFIFYTVSIFEEAGEGMSPSMATIIVGVVLVAATFLSSLVVDCIGRRILLLFSGVGMVMCYVILVAYFYLRDVDIDVSGLEFIPLASVTAFIAVFNIGFGPLPWFMMAELIPTADKKWATGLATCVNWASLFAVVKVFGVCTNAIGPTWTFSIFCLVSVIATIFVAFWVPETKGKTSEEIQAALIGNKRRCKFYHQIINR